MLSQYWILNSAKLIEHADMRKSVKYLFPKNIIFQRAVREDKESYVLNMNSLSEREYTSAPFSRAPPGLQTRSRDLAHMQLLTLPINPQNPGPVDICHGRNSLVHDATRNAVLVGGRDSAIHIKSGADGDTESSEFIMPGLHVYHHFNPVLDTFPTKALTEGAASEIRVAK